jgi:hypothetical protein
MSRSLRWWIFLGMLGIILILGWVFWPFVLDQILAPMALTAWLFLRIFVLSVDQKIYWSALILGAGFFLFRRLFLNTAGEEPVSQPEGNLTLKDIDFWRSFLSLYTHEDRDQFYIKRELVRLLVSMYASKQGVAANFIVMESLKKGEISLPESIYTFLFEDEKPQAGGSIKQFLEQLWLAPGRWWYEYSGRKAAEYYRLVEEVLTFLEMSLEIKDGK